MTVLVNIVSPSFWNTINIPSKLQNNGTKVYVGNKASTGYSIKRNSRLIIKCSADIDINDFPVGFKIGGSMSAIQSESEASAGGRGPSTLDEPIAGLAGAQSLYKYNEDVLCLKNMNANGYRFSISWSRLFPTGEVSDATLNKDGLIFYQNFLTQLVLNGIEPFVTLFHFDMPQALLTKYNGAMSPQFVDDFNAYAEFCFKTFGDKVKNWMTLNQPHIWSSVLYKLEMDAFDHGTYPYRVGYHLLKAHATAYNTYKTKYKRFQNGKVGLSLNAQWFFAFSPSRPDKDAARRAWDFMVGWFLDPLVYGNYPFNMISIARERLPQLTEEDQKAIKGSFDFIGINYYTSSFVSALPMPHPDGQVDFDTDHFLERSEENYAGQSIGPVAEGNATMRVCPVGLYKILKFLQNEYNNPLVYITENGYPQLRDDDLAISEALVDDVRIQFIKDHLSYIFKAKKEGSNVDGYFYWNLMDCVELTDRDKIRFGLNYTDYSNNYNRIPKKSANWLKIILGRVQARAPVTPVEPVVPLPVPPTTPVDVVPPILPITPVVPVQPAATVETTPPIESLPTGLN